MKTPLILLLFTVFAGSATAQEVITLLNGREINAQTVNATENDIRYTVAGSGRTKRLDGYKVFNIKSANGDERMIYRKDADDSLEFSVEQMRLYIKGEQEAIQFYHSPVVNLGAFVAGVMSVNLAFLSIAVPPIYSTAVGSFSPNMSKAKVSDPALRSVPEFCEGYQAKARNKKIKQSFLFGSIGLLSSIAVLQVVK